MIEGWATLGRPGCHLHVGLRDVQRWSIGILKSRRALDWRVLRPVLPGRHGVIVDGTRALPIRENLGPAQLTIWRLGSKSETATLSALSWA